MVAVYCSCVKHFSTELMECYQSLDLDVTHVRCLSTSAIKNIVLDRFKRSLV